MTRTVVGSGDVPETLKQAVEILRRGGLVAFPTETVYGLGADALNPEAITRVFAAKGRPLDNPLIIHVAAAHLMDRFSASVPAIARRLAEAFWPGPLTVIVERNDLVPDEVTAGLDTVAIRVPRHPVTLRLLEMFDGGIVGPSANVSGRPSPTRAEHVMQDLSGKIDFIIDAGATSIGLESTVVDCTVSPPAILRTGAVTREQIECVTGATQPPGTTPTPRSPGTRHCHYAPRAKVVLVVRGDAGSASALARTLSDRRLKGVLISHSTSMNEIDIAGMRHVRLASEEELARRLYQLFRELDDAGADVVAVETVEERGLGVAIMDRLKRASGEGA